MLEAMLLTKACSTGRLAFADAGDSYKLIVRWFGVSFPIATVTKKELDAARRPKLGVVA